MALLSAANTVGQGRSVLLGCTSFLDEYFDICRMENKGLMDGKINERELISIHGGAIRGQKVDRRWTIWEWRLAISKSGHESPLCQNAYCQCRLLCITEYRARTTRRERGRWKAIFHRSQIRNVGWRLRPLWRHYRPRKSSAWLEHWGHYTRGFHLRLMKRLWETHLQLMKFTCRHSLIIMG